MSAWPYKSLGSLCSIKTGRKDVNEGSQNGAFPFFTCSKDVHASDSYSFDTEAIIIAGNGAVGETKLYRGKFEAYQRTYVLDGFAEDLEFVYFYLKGVLIDELKQLVTGSTMPYIRKGDLENVQVPIPELAEQRRIARVLGTVQQAIEQQERMIRSTTELKQALMQKLFTEGLRGEAQKETEIGPVPESWEVVKLGSLGHIGNGSTPKRTENGYWDGGTYSWLNSTKIHERFIEHADQFVTGLAKKECHLPIVPANSLLIAITGQGKTLGNIALTRIETSINQHLAYVKFNSEKVKPEFLLWYMSTLYDQLRSVAHGSGSTKGALTCSYLKSLEVPLPRRDEQDQITEVFAQLEQKTRNAEKKRTALQDLFRTLLHELMTGKVRVGETLSN